jgi:polycomb protein EED
LKRIPLIHTFILQPLLITSADCVQFVGDLILSKSVHNVVVLWKPVVTNEDSASFNTIYPSLINDDSDSDDMIPSRVIFLRNFTAEHCDSWFIRFHSPSPYNEVLALGNQKGEIKVWRLMGSENGEENDEDMLSEALLCKLKAGDSTVRMITFAGRECLLAVCEDASVWAFEAKE